MSPLVLLTIACTILATSSSTELNPNATNEVAKEEPYISPNYGITWNRYTIAATAAATVLVIAGIAASVSLFLPLIAYKVCYLVGGCRYGLNSYVDQFIATDGHPRHKRNVEYFGPILQALAAAYEKYGEDPKKKLDRLSSSTS